MESTVLHHDGRSTFLTHPTRPTNPTYVRYNLPLLSLDLTYISKGQAMYVAGAIRSTPLPHRKTRALRLPVPRVFSRPFSSCFLCPHRPHRPSEVRAEPRAAFPHAPFPLLSLGFTHTHTLSLSLACARVLDPSDPGHAIILRT